MEITNLSKKEFKRMQSDGAETSSRNVYVFKTQVVKTVAALKMAKQQTYILQLEDSNVAQKSEYH